MSDVAFDIVDGEIVLESIYESNGRSIKFDCLEFLLPLLVQF